MMNAGKKKLISSRTYPSVESGKNIKIEAKSTSKVFDATPSPNP
jgi:hypothetical protein